MYLIFIVTTSCILWVGAGSIRYTLYIAWRRRYYIVAVREGICVLQSCVITLHPLSNLSIACAAKSLSLLLSYLFSCLGFLPLLLSLVLTLFSLVLGLLFLWNAGTLSSAPAPHLWQWYTPAFSPYVPSLSIFSLQSLCPSHAISGFPAPGFLLLGSRTLYPEVKRKFTRKCVRKVRTQGSKVRESSAVTCTVLGRTARRDVGRETKWYFTADWGQLVLIN